MWPEIILIAFWVLMAQYFARILGQKSLSQLFSFSETLSQGPLNLLMGLMPLIFFQVLFSLLYWNQSPSPQWPSHFILTLKTVYFLGGLYCFQNNFPSFWKFLKSKTSSFFSQPFLFIFAVIFVIFWPSLALRAGFHPSWDSDAVGIWLPKCFNLISDGFLGAASDPVHASYFSWNIESFAALIPPIFSHLEWIIVFRIFSLLFFFECFLIISKNMSFPIRLFLLATLLSGFPLKWINGYQDTGLAMSILFWASLLYESKQAQNANFHSILLSLLWISGLKNEGLIFAVILSIYTVAQTQKGPSQKQVLILLGLALPLILWRLAPFIYSMNNSDLALKAPPFSELIPRLVLIAKKMGEGLGRKYQSWILESTVDLLTLLFILRPLSKLTKQLLLLAFLLALIPVGVIFFTPHDFTWHLSTTFSRITTSSCLLIIYCAAQEMNRKLTLTL